MNLSPLKIIIGLSALAATIVAMVAGSFAESPGRNLLGAAIDADRKGDLDQAIRLYSQAILSGALSRAELASALNGRGVMYRLQGDIARAVADYTRAIEIQPDFAVAYSNRGLAQAKSGRYGAAIEDFNRSIEIRPDHAMTYLKRGNAYFDKGELELAIDDWTRAIALQSDLMRAYYNRCDAYDRKGLKDLAIADCRKVLELEPGFTPARVALEWLTGPQTGPRPCFCND